MEYEADGSSPRGKPKLTWREVVQNAQKLSREDSIDHIRWRKLIKAG